MHLSEFTTNLLYIFLLQVSCGSWHGCAVDDKGMLFAWGYNKSHGVLGVETLSSFAPPIQISSLSSIKVAGVTCGNNYSLAWTEDGVVYSWGFGQHGVLGQGDTNDRQTPTQVAALSSHQVALVNAGFSHCGALCRDGKLFMFGQAKYGALGLGQEKLKDTSMPALVDMPEGVTFSDLSCSKGDHHGHTLAVTSEGCVYACGDGYKGKLGLGDQNSRYIPTLIPKENFGGASIIYVSSGGIHSSAVSKEGQVFTWGCGSDGRLGHPEAKGHRYLFRSDIPRVVEHLTKLGQATGISASYYHTAAIVQHK